MFLSVLSFAGLRVGEACALQVGDIDWLHRKINIVRQVQHAGRPSLEVSAPKFDSTRGIVIPDDLINILAEHVGQSRNSDTDWLFSGPPHQGKITDRWRSTSRRAGVRGFTPHSLRHWYASGLINSGADVVTVSRALGHSSPTITLRVYAHLWPTAEDKTRSAAANLMTLVQDHSAFADSLRTADSANPR